MSNDDHEKARGEKSATVRRQRRRFIAIFSIIVLIGTVAASLPGSMAPAGGMASIAYLWLTAGLISGAWLAGACGVGLVLLRLVGWPAGRASDLLPAAGAGVALFLWLAHGLGAIGAFAGFAGPIVAWMGPMVGIMILAARAVAHRNSGPPMMLPEIGWLAAAPGVALLVVASAIPAGMLWGGAHGTEGGGYDALSYHMQLPKEWLAAGTIRPLEHNVYSWLPSYVEAAFTQLGVMLTWPGRPPDVSGGSALPMHAAQMLHAMLGGLTALCVAALIRVFWTATNQSSSTESSRITDRHTLAALCGALVMLTPWVLVVGSLAYNELFVTFLFASALRVAAEPAIRPIMRGILLGMLLGTATGAKANAVYMCAPMAILVLLAHTPRSQWWRLGAAAISALLVMIGPWLIRNWLAGGNPVFPFATGIFGSAHWTAEQAARWDRGHTLDATLLERLGLLASDRGFLHLQWSIVPLLAFVGAIICVTSGSLRRVTWPLVVGMLLQLGCWLFIGHLQSRFFLPMLVPMLVVFGLGAITVAGRDSGRAHGVSVALVGVAAVILGAMTVFVYARQNDGAPARGLAVGAAGLNGAALEDLLPQMPRAMVSEQLQSASPENFVNAVIRRGLGEPLVESTDRGLYLLGGGTPFYFESPVLYHTTWDRNPFGTLLRAQGGDLNAVTSGLRGLGIEFVLVDFSELDRLISAGWYDPDVTLDTVVRFVETQGLAIRSWPERGQMLLRLHAEPGN